MAAFSFLVQAGNSDGAENGGDPKGGGNGARSEEGGKDGDQNDLGSHHWSGHRDVTNFEREKGQGLGENEEEGDHKRLPKEGQLDGRPSERPEEEKEDGSCRIADEACSPDIVALGRGLF